MGIIIEKLVTWQSIGITLIFISWITQNFMYSSFSSKKSKFEYDMAFISNEMSVLSPWMILFNTERIKKKSHKEVLWNASLNIVKSIRSILKAAEQYHSSDNVKDSLTSEKMEAITSDLRSAKEQNKITEIIALTSLVCIAFPQVDTQTRQAMLSSYNNIARSEDFWRKTFLFLYILGSVFLGIGYIVPRLS